MQPIGAVLKDSNIILKGADAATTKGFTQVPNFLLKSNKLSSGDKLAFARLLSYAWQNAYCFPGSMNQLFKKLATDAFLAGASSDNFVDAVADFLGELNAIHPFREGNGRAQLSFPSRPRVMRAAPEVGPFLQVETEVSFDKTDGPPAIRKRPHH